jgi:hypothetical protein
MCSMCMLEVMARCQYHIHIFTYSPPSLQTRAAARLPTTARFHLVVGGAEHARLNKAFMSHLRTQIVRARNNREKCSAHSHAGTWTHSPRALPQGAAAHTARLQLVHWVFLGPFRVAHACGAARALPSSSLVALTRSPCAGCACPACGLRVLCGCHD